MEQRQTSTEDLPALLRRLRAMTHDHPARHKRTTIPLGGRINPDAS